MKRGEELELNLGDGLGPHTVHGKAIPFTQIFFGPRIPTWDYDQLRTSADANGNYQIRGLQSGEYAVTLMSSSAATGLFLNVNASVQIEGDTTQDFDHRGAVRDP